MTSTTDNPPRHLTAEKAMRIQQLHRAAARLNKRAENQYDSRRRIRAYRAVFRLQDRAWELLIGSLSVAELSRLSSIVSPKVAKAAQPAAFSAPLNPSLTHV